jgi:hypothetical protein
MSEPRIEDRPIEPDAGGAAPVVRPAGRLVVWLVSGIVICAFLLFDCLVPRIVARTGPGDAWWVGILLGICVGQLHLTAAWAVLARGNLVVRLPWALLLAAAMWYALVLGLRTDPFFRRADAVGIGLMLFAGVTVSQVPLWGKRSHPGEQ